jgi:hypothetical protein
MVDAADSKSLFDLDNSQTVANGDFTIFKVLFLRSGFEKWGLTFWGFPLHGGRPFFCDLMPPVVTISRLTFCYLSPSCAFHPKTHQIPQGTPSCPSCSP